MSSKGKGYRVEEWEGFEILVGKGDSDNDVLTFSIADPGDFWLHVAGFSGSHVIIRNPAGLQDPPRQVLDRAATLAAWHSKARGSRGKIDVHYCKVADVRKPRGAPAGQVLLGKWKTIKVYARETC